MTYLLIKEMIKLFNYYVNNDGKNDINNSK